MTTTLTAAAASAKGLATASDGLSGNGGGICAGSVSVGGTAAFRVFCCCCVAGYFVWLRFSEGADR